LVGFGSGVPLAGAFVAWCVIGSSYMFVQAKGGSSMLPPIKAAASTRDQEKDLKPGHPKGSRPLGFVKCS